ncbi:MAG TPA: flagellar basal body P-ring formation protein FlgA [Firmicutes bacterium]|nr:flagellar basal body P-ring formation protein FlgA [Bacillota bacterium]
MTPGAASRAGFSAIGPGTVRATSVCATSAKNAKIWVVTGLFAALMVFAGQQGWAGDSTEVPGHVLIIIDSPVDVDGPWIRLGDIARIEGDTAGISADLGAIELGRAALPGRTRTITLNSIKVRLRKAHVDPVKVELRAPERITVLTRSTVVTGRGIADEAKKFAEQNVSWPGAEVKVEVTRLPEDILLPVGDVSLSVNTMPTTRLPGNTTLMVTVLFDGKPYKNVPVPLDVKVVGQVVVAARTIRRYEVITEDAVRVEKRDISQFYDKAVSSVDEVIGKWAARTIQPGYPIERDCLEEAPVVTRGMRVTIVAEKGGVRVTGIGEALEDGHEGQVIRVRNLDTNRQVQGIVRDAATVEVIL